MPSGLVLCRSPAVRGLYALLPQLGREAALGEVRLGGGHLEVFSQVVEGLGKERKWVRKRGLG